MNLIMLHMGNPNNYSIVQINLQIMIWYKSLWRDWWQQGD